MTILSLTCLGAAFALIYYVYMRHIPEADLARRCVHKMDFIIFTFARLTEPEPLPWFPKISAGITYAIILSH